MIEAAQRVAVALARARVKYAIGGALAYGLYGAPRGTVDVDINVFVDADEAPRVLDVLERAGVAFERAKAISDANTEGMMVGQFGAWPVDVFFASIPFSTEAAKTRKRHTIAGREAWFLSAEAIAIFKLLFFRGKDQVDLERLVVVMGDKLDQEYVRAKLVDMMGDDDERVRFWERVIRGAP